MAIKKQIEIKVDAKSAIKDTEKLADSLKDVNEEAVPLSKSIQDLEKQLLALATAGKEGTDEFIDAGNKLRNYKEVLKETKETAEGAGKSVGTNLKDSFGGVTEGVDGAKDAMGAFGVESEAVEGVIGNMEGAMQLADGVAGIQKGLKAFKLMKKAIMANTVVQKILNVVMNMNPIGKIILAVTALIGLVYLLIDPIKDLMQWFGLTGDEIEDVEASNEKLNESYEKSAKVIDKITEAQERRHNHAIKMLELEGATEEEIHQARIDKINDLSSLNSIDLMNKKAAITEGTRLYHEAIKQEDNELATSLREQNDKRRDERDALIALDDDYYNNKIVLGKQEENRVQKEIDDGIDARKAAGKQRKADRENAAKSDLDTARELEDLKLANTEDGREKEIQSALNAQERLQVDRLANEQIDDEEFEALKLASEEALRLKLKNINAKFDEEEGAEQKEKDDKAKKEELAAEEKFEEDKKALKLDFAARNKTEEEQELFELEEKYNAELILFEDDLILKKQLEEEYEENVNEIKVDFAEKERQRKHAAIADGLNLATEGLQAVSAVSNLLLDGQIEAAEGNEKKQEQLRRKAFESNKKLQLGMAIIDGFKAANASIAASPLAFGPIPNPAGIASLAFAITTSAANVAKIATTKYKGGKVGGNTPPPSLGGDAPTPQFNVVGEGSGNQLAQSLGENNNTPIQAFVVSGDVTTAQGLDRNIIDTASL